MADIKSIAETLVNLTVKEVQELATVLKDEYGIEPAAAAVVVSGGGGGPAAEEKTSFDVILKEAGAAKLGVPRLSASVEAWLAGFDVKPWPMQASLQYASVRLQLERAGTPIGGMDVLIAAHALAEDSVLITNNAREFHRVPGLAVEEWALTNPL